jgi:thiamine transporter ThiT
MWPRALRLKDKDLHETIIYYDAFNTMGHASITSLDFAQQQILALQTLHQHSELLGFFKRIQIHYVADVFFTLCPPRGSRTAHFPLCEALCFVIGTVRFDRIIAFENIRNRL